MASASTQTSTQNQIDPSDHQKLQGVLECTGSAETLAGRVLQASQGHAVIVPSES